MRITLAAAMLVLLSLVLSADPPVIDAEKVVGRPNISTADWDRRRWTEFLGNRRGCETFVPTPAGCLVDLVDDHCAWSVRFDADWREAVSEAILCGVATEKDPGVWLLCPDARVQHYLECQIVIQRLRAYGVPIRIRTMAVLPSGEFFDGSEQGGDADERFSQARP